MAIGSTGVYFKGVFKGQILFGHKYSDTLTDFLCFHNIDLLHFFDTVDSCGKPAGCYFIIGYGSLISKAS